MTNDEKEGGWESRASSRSINERQEAPPGALLVIAVLVAELAHENSRP
jgi:hypothetical protein